MNRKKFDCVEMMHRAQAAERKLLRGMTLEEKLEYWRKGTEEMRALQHKSQRSKAATGKR